MLFAAAMVLVMAVPAGAKGPPDGKGPKDPEPIVGMTCAEADDYFKNIGASVDAVPTDDGFKVVMHWKDHACIDVLAAAGNWIVDVDLGDADATNLAIGDSAAPSDTCWRETVTESGEVPILEVPAADYDACGDRFADGDPRLIFVADTVGLRKGDTPVTITVTLPEGS
jgi:hypothetical protein